MAAGTLTEADQRVDVARVRAATLRSCILMAAIVMLCGLASQAGWLLFGRGAGVLHNSTTARPLLNVLLIDSAITAGLALVAALIQSRMARAVARAKQSARRMRGIAAAAQTACDAKSIFLANMSHEVRTPLISILGYAELLHADEGLSGVQRREAVDAIRRNGEHLLTMINDLLDLSKAESSRAATERVALDPAEQAREAANLLSADAEKKGVALRVCFDTPMPVSIESDPTKIRQVLFNLVGNAVKFTSEGSVTVRCSLRRGGRMPAPVLVYEVVDTGIGIAQEEMGHLFRPYEQADATTTRRFGGTGLGLALSRTLARNLGGDITVSSQPGRGSVFTFTLPVPEVAEDGLVEQKSDAVVKAAAAPEKTVAALTPPRRVKEGAEVGAGARVLIADDSPDYQRLLVFMFRREGIKADTAKNGREAVIAVADRERVGRPYDLIMMDLQMPELDGVSAVKEIRAAGSKSAIVAFTAAAMETDRAQCLDAGCDEFTLKPIGREGLREVCDRFVRGQMEVGAVGTRLARGETERVAA